jgi:hypothetical protein
VASTIKIKRSGVANKTPTTADIATGELAINYKDQKLFSSNGTAVFQIGASGGGGGGGLVSITTASVKNLTQNDTVVTSVSAVVSNNYLQVANAVATYLTKINPVVTGTLTANGSTGTAGYYLRTSGTGVYWSSVAASGATWAALTSTNTALRTLISDRLQVANAAAVYQTKAVERAALANTNSRINLINTNLTGTNTALRTLINDRYQVSNVNSNFFKKTGVIAQTVTPLTTFSANVSIQGKLFVTGGIQTYSANNLSIGDNMIYLNSGSSSSNPDLGFAANYNDGTYHHTGFFRDASDAGTWKVFENYLPEPDANVYINTAHATFRLAPFSAQNITVARNLTVVANSTLGNTSVTGFLKLNGTDIRATFAANSYVKSVLANTNAYIATKVNTTTFNSALANTNSYIATRATWASVTGTNTAIRALVSDRLQVANAVVTYQTKAIERAALANTNSYIAAQATRITLVNTNLTGTNTALRTLISDRLQVANASTLYATKSNPTTSGLLAHTGRATISTNLTVSGNSTVSGTMTATGIVSGSELTSTLASGDEGGQINLAKPPNATTRGGITIDAYQNKVRIFEQGGTARGVYIDLTAAAAGVGTNLLTGGSSTTQYLQVANAVATYATKAYAAANSYVKSVLANTNAYIGAQATRITLVNTNLTGTNTALRTLINDRLQVANASTLYATKSNPTTSGLLAHTGRATISTNLTVSGNTTISAGLIANNSVGTAGYYLRSSGTGVYWSPAVTPNRVISYTDQNSITINADTTDTATQSYTGAAGTLTINAPTGTLVNGQKILFRLTTTNAQTLSFNAIFRGSTDLTLPTTSSGSSKTDYLAFIYNSAASKWDLLAKNFGY